MMNNALAEILEKIGKRYRETIAPGGRHYLELDIEKEAARLGHTLDGGKFVPGHVVIPLKEPSDGMKVRIDGRAWVGYAQFETGVVVPGNIAKKAGLPYRKYEAQDSMIKNFTQN
jgi:hypothetical protein